MLPKALFIGSIGVMAETSDIQRNAYNQALSEQNVDWQWSKDLYQDLLQSSGGKNRLRTLSNATNGSLSQEQIDQIHARKTEIACNKIKEQGLSPRPGVAEMIEAARAKNIPVVWVTSTYEDNTSAILEAMSDKFSADSFDHIFHRQDASEGKPSPEIYQAALKKYGLNPSEGIAIEDSLMSVLSAKAAGIFTVVAPGAFHTEHVNNIADVVVDSLDEISWDELVSKYQKTTQSAVATN